MPAILHAHSWYSLLEGVSSPPALLARAAALGYDSLALTDTNNLYGCVAFVEQAIRHGIRPLLGAYLRQQRTRCVALIAEQVGYRNLCKIISRLNLQNDESSTLIDLLASNADGLHILTDDIVLLERLREAFGSRLWLEVVRPGTGSRQEQSLLSAARRLGVRPIASTAVHFATPEEYPTHRLGAAIRQHSLLEQVPAQLPVTPAHTLISPEELRHRFDDLPAAIQNGEILAEILRSDVLPHEVVLPTARLPQGKKGRTAPVADAHRYLEHLCERGLRRRELGADLAARQRLREELAILHANDLAGYFLTVRDIARYARRRGHSMALRGSAGNSLVCYVLGITDVNPLRFGLKLDRFLHPGRIDLPDIDLDFDWKVRDEVIAHVVERYGPVHTAQISSHLFFQPRSAFREAGRIHGLSDEQISDLLTTLSERVTNLLLPDPRTGSASEYVPRSFPLEPGRWPRLITDARRLLGKPHYLSIHPGGVVITPGPIEEHAPLQRAAKGVVITQFDKDGVEQVGLVKIDLLGNRALATVDEASRFVGIRLPIELENDSPTLALLRRGDTLGVNQLESPAMRHLLIQMQAHGLEDAICALALLRPGAAEVGMKETFIRRRRGLEPESVPHPLLADLLRETHGLMVYEDDALYVLQALTGLGAADADRLRKRITRLESADGGQEIRAELTSLCHARGIGAAVIEEIWPHLVKFRLYSFCKSHAVSYGLIAWRACYLKAHHPLPFWTAALNNNQGAYPRCVYVEAIKQAGIELRLPCVNRSAGPFVVEDSSIRVGLDAIAGLPEEIRGQIVAERQRGGPYVNLGDFRTRLRPGPETLAVLIRCGALDDLGPARPALFLQADLLVNGEPPCPELFADSPVLDWKPDDYDVKRRLRDEWRLLGFIVGPPLFSLVPRAVAPPGPPIVASTQLAAFRGKRVRVQGFLATARNTHTSDGRAMQFISLQDEHGLVDVTLFPGNCPTIPYLGMGPYLATGIVEEQYDVLTVTAYRFEPQSVRLVAEHGFS